MRVVSTQEIIEILKIFMGMEKEQQEEVIVGYQFELKKEKGGE